MARSLAGVDLEDAFLDALLDAWLDAVLRADGVAPARFVRGPDAVDGVAVCLVERDRASSRERPPPVVRRWGVAVVWERLPAVAP